MLLRPSTVVAVRGAWCVDARDLKHRCERGVARRRSRVAPTSQTVRRGAFSVVKAYWAEKRKGLD
jgi:hypothetical protein